MGVVALSREERAELRGALAVVQAAPHCHGCPGAQRCTCGLAIIERWTAGFLNGGKGHDRDE